MASPLAVSLAFGQTMLVRCVESVVFAFGITGSICNIVLFSQRQFRANACCIYFLASSVAAIILLLTGILPKLYALSNTPSSLFNRDFCKAQGYVTQLSAMLCRWLLTMACIDRCLMSSTYARLRLFSTIRTARRTVLLLVAIWIVLPVHMLVFTDVRVPGYIACMMSNSGAAFYHTIYTITVGGILPPLIMLICTAHIWKTLKAKKQRGARITSNGRKRRHETRDYQILFMLLLQVILFIVSTIPYMTFNLYLASTRLVSNKSINRLAIESFLQLCTEIFVYIYPAITFYSNTLISRTFQRELIAIFRWILTCGRWQRHRHRQRVGPNTLTATVLGRNALPMVMVN